MKKISQVLFAFILLFHCVTLTNVFADSEKTSCPICSMDVSLKSKTTFQATDGARKMGFCSFSCAHAYHQRKPAVSLSVPDFESGKLLDVKTAYFLVNSKNLLKELDFGMPPAIVAFSTEKQAKVKQQKLKDGEVVKGYSTLEKLFP